MDMNNQNNLEQDNNFGAGTYSQSQQNPYDQQNAYGYGQQNTYNQQSYNQPAYTQPTQDETVSVLDWIGTVLLAAVPCVGLIVYIIWAFSKDTKKSKSNFCKAQLIMMLIGVVLYIIMVIIMVAVVGISASDLGSSYYY